MIISTSSPLRFSAPGGITESTNLKDQKYNSQISLQEEKPIPGLGGDARKVMEARKQVMEWLSYGHNLANLFSFP